MSLTLYSPSRTIRLLCKCAWRWFPSIEPTHYLLILSNLNSQHLNLDSARCCCCPGADWEIVFQKASELLFDATDGQHQFGRIYVCNSCTGGRNADAWLDDSEDSDANSGNPTPPNLGLGADAPTAHQNFHRIHRFRPFIITHEFGHYAYGLGDETNFGGDEGRCTGDETTNACIMEWGYDKGVRLGKTVRVAHWSRGLSVSFAILIITILTVILFRIT